MINKDNNNNHFLISYKFFEKTGETELSMFIDGNNILAFKRDGQTLTTRWNLDELALWLRNFIDNMEEDPYPVEVDGDYAAIKDINAREFDSEDDDEFDAYYDKLDEWNLRHRWHTTANGAILADLYFQLRNGYVEISWNNLDSEEGVKFLNEVGGNKVPKKEFYEVVDTFLKEYADNWFSV